MTREHDVVPLLAAHRERAADAVTRAFLDDPMWSCILPDREVRAEALRPMWAALIAFSRVYGEVFTTRDGEGAACWIAPENVKMTVWMMLRTRFALPRSIMRLPKEERRRFFGMLGFIDRLHKELMPERHWHLWLLGVAPEVQGQGIGRALLLPILERADAEGIPCYLETQTETNVAFYRKSGFDVIAERSEPVCNLPIWFLRRDPRS